MERQVTRYVLAALATAVAACGGPRPAGPGAGPSAGPGAPPAPGDPAPSAVQPPGPPSPHADPLPEGAIGRLGSLRYKFAHGAFLDVSDDGRYVVSTGESTEVTVRRMDDGSLVSLWEVKDAFLLAGPVHAAGDRYVVGYQVVDAAGATVLKLAAASGAQIEDIDVRAGVIAAVDDHRHLYTWDATTLVPGRVLATGKDADCVALSPSGRLAAVCAGAVVDLVDLRRRTHRTLYRPASRPDKLAFAGEDRLAVSDGFNDLELIDVATGKALHALKVTDDPDGAITTDVAATGDGAWIVVTANMADARAWRVSDGTPAPAIPTLPQVTSSVAPVGDGAVVAIHNRASSVIWDVAAGRRTIEVPGPAGGVLAVAVSTDGTQIATTAEDGSVRIWSVAAHRDGGGTEAEVVIAQTDESEAVLWLGADRLLAGNGHGTTLIERGVVTKAGLGPVTNALGALTGGRVVKGTGMWHGGTQVQAGPYGDELLDLECEHCRTAGVGDRFVVVDKDVVLYDATSLKELARVNYGDSAIDVAVAGDLIAVGGFQIGGLYRRDGAKLARLRDITIVNNLIAPEYSPISSVALSPDGALVASGYLDGTVLVEDTATGERLATLRAHLGRIHDLAFAPDASFLVSGSADTTALIWPAAAWAR